MADTRQVVSWSLERKCPFRTGNQWFLPEQTCKQLADLRTVASAENDDRNVAGICVTSWTMGRDKSGIAHDIPCSGFHIEKQLGTVGGLSAALATCGACEANARTELKIDVAGCFGYLDVWPESKELDAQLWRIIEERTLEQRLRSAFPITAPLWYGLWINSPLMRLQTEVLHELLDTACDPDDPEDKDVRHFLSALTAAIQWELPIHVSLSPLGHTDFGWYTVFPHCPRCKANAPVGRWKESYQTTPYECHVCGHSFNPDQNRSQERDDRNWDAQSLEKQLGKAGYEQFIRTFLIHCGCSEEQVHEIIDNENNGPLLRRIKEVRRKRNATIHSVRQKPVSKSSDEQHDALSIALADDLEIEFVLVRAGEFVMGSPNDEEDPDETPQHVVQILQPFYMGRYPVTQAQWVAVMEKNPSQYRGDPRFPVDQVSWIDCQDFCERLCHRQRRVFRLPSEAEWEYACRAGTTTKYAFGDTISVEQVNFTPLSQLYGSVARSEEDAVRKLEQAAEKRAGREGRPTPVGSFPPNAWGIYDMHGNVDEWCEDVWHPNYQGAPTDGSAWLDTEYSNPFRVMRGGWASGTERVCTSSSRRQMRADAGSSDNETSVDETGEHDISEALLDLIYAPYGFRVICEVS